MLGGLEPGEPDCNSLLPSRMVDEHRRQPVCRMVAVTKRWHGEAGVWRIARRRTSVPRPAQPKRMTTPQPFRLHIIVKRSITAANIGKICTHRRIDASTIDSYRNGAYSLYLALPMLLLHRRSGCHLTPSARLFPSALCCSCGTASLPSRAVGALSSAAVSSTVSG